MAACDYNSARKIGKDDWLISPAINMKGGKAYIIEFDVGTGSDFGENLRVGFSNEPTVEAMNQNILLDTTYFQSCIFTRARVVATPKTDGKYYFGLHACTPTLQYYMDFDNVDIYAALDPSTPDVPANLLPVVKRRHGSRCLVHGTQNHSNRQGSRFDSQDRGDTRRQCAAYLHGAGTGSRTEVFRCPGTRHRPLQV